MQGPTTHDGIGGQDCAWREYGVGSDAAVVAYERTELGTAGVVQHFARSDADLLVSTFIAVVADDAACLEVDVRTEDGVADEVEVGELRSGKDE